MPNHSSKLRSVSSFTISENFPSISSNEHNKKISEPTSTEIAKVSERRSDGDIADVFAKQSPMGDILSFSHINNLNSSIAVTDGELAYFHATKYVLNSHKNLTEKDIEYVANYMGSFYDHSIRKLEKDPNADNILTDDQFILFLVYSDKHGIGKFALTFNEELDKAIINKNSTELRKIIVGPKEMFVELYDNTFLTDEDKEFIIRLLSREMYAAMMVFNLIKQKLMNLEDVNYQCTRESFEIDSFKTVDGINVTSMATQCYDEVCIQDAKILADDLVRAEMSKYEKISEYIYTVDKPSTMQTPQVYCFDTLDLLNAVTKNIPINPKTNEQFSDAALRMINQRFRKEIAMYKRYKQHK